MSMQTINLGTTPADGTGDKLRTAFTKVNANFAEVYEALDDAASADALASHVAATGNPHAVTKAQVGLGNADNTSDANKPISTATQTVLNAKADASALTAETAARIAADALKADLVGGIIPTAQIPAIAITSFLGSVASEAAMLALSGQSGDWCNRSDTSTAWVIIGTNPAQLSSWAQINYPVSPVTSVNGQSGVIVLGKADVGLGNADNTSDANKPISTATQTALDGKAASTHTHAIANITGLQTALDGKAASTHASSHKAGGGDAIKLDELGAPTDVTTLNATTSAHGLLPKLGGGTTNFLRADGTWAAPAGGGGGANGLQDFAFVNASTGNNSTAVMGDPTKPYATLAAAYAASLGYLQSSRVKLFLQTNVPEVLTVSTNALFITLRADERVVVNGVTFSNVSAATLVGSGRSLVTVNDVTTVWSGAANGSGGTFGGGTGGDGSNGEVAPTLWLKQLDVRGVDSVGGVGGSGGAGGEGDSSPGNGGTGGMGGAGGAGATLIFEDCYLSGSIVARGGSGGTGGDGGTGGSDGTNNGADGLAARGGDGGAGGTLYLKNCLPPAPDFTPATFDAAGGAAGSGGNGSGGSGGSGSAGASGTVELYWSEVGVISGATGSARVSFYNGAFAGDASF